MSYIEGKLIDIIGAKSMQGTVLIVYMEQGETKILVKGQSGTFTISPNQIIDVNG